VRAELGWLGQSLAEVRDYDVLIGHLREVIADFEVRDQAPGGGWSPVRHERGSAKRRLTRRCRALRYSTLLRGQPAGAARGLPEESTVDGTTARPDRRGGQAAPQARQACAHCPPTRRRRLHALRIHGKKLRYAAELAQTSAKKKQAAKIKGADQGHQGLPDRARRPPGAVIAAERMRTVLDDADGPVGFVAGRVAERELARVPRPAPPGRGLDRVDNAPRPCTRDGS